MFSINDDNSIYVTRGDALWFSVTAKDEETGDLHIFAPGDVIRIKVFEKKNAETVVLQKDFPIVEETEYVEIILDKEDTKIGGVISKSVDYWYEVELNPETPYPQTIIGYDEEGPKVFKLFPEGADTEAYEPGPDDFPVVDDKLDLSSPRPVQNQVIARTFMSLKAVYEKAYKAVAGNVVKMVQGKEQITFNIDADASIIYSTFEQSGIISVRNDLASAPTIQTLVGDAPTLTYDASAGTVTLAFPENRTITFITKFAIVE